MKRNIRALREALYALVDVLITTVIRLIAKLIK